MNIENIKINEYGTLNNKEIKLNKGINIIHGNNESGKSTLLSYINSMLYGIGRTKDGRSMSDYEKYKPWNSAEFSGRISYYLDNGEKYEVFRDFNKKSPKIYNQNLEDISSNFNIDKKEGNQFFVEQTGVNKQMYLSTVVSMQQEVRLEDKEQNALIQKIANIAGTGEDNVSYKNAMTKLQNKIRDEIGTSNTKQKPLNNVNNELSKIDEEIKEILPYKNRKYEIEDEKDRIKKELISVEESKKNLEELKQVLESQNESRQKFKINENEIKQNKLKLVNLYNENDGYEINIRKIQEEILKLENRETELKKQLNEEQEPNKIKSKKVNIKWQVILELIFIIAVVLSIVLLKNKIITIISGAFTIINMLIIVIRKIKYDKKYKEEEEKNKQNKINEENKINNEISEIEENIKNKNLIKNEKISSMSMLKGQIDLLENKNSEIEEEQKNINAAINDVINSKVESIVKQSKGDYELYNVSSIDEANLRLRDITEKVNDKKVKLNSIEIEENTVIPHVENLVLLEERKIACQNEFAELIDKANVIKLAMANLEEAYEEMKNNITPKFTQNLSSTIQKISNNKYSKVAINDINGIVVESERGEYIDANKLSCGTIDQLYLALRLSMIDELSKETLPIMLDETFAYFDEQRMEEALQYLNKNINNHQAIIFTCSNREREILEKLDIEYNNVEL